MDSKSIQTTILFLAGTLAGGAVVMMTRTPSDQAEVAATPQSPTSDKPSQPQTKKSQDSQLEHLKQLQFARMRRRQPRRISQDDPPPATRPQSQGTRAATEQPTKKLAASTPSQPVAPPKLEDPPGMFIVGRDTHAERDLTPEQQLASLERKRISKLHNTRVMQPLDLTPRNDPLEDLVVYVEPTKIPPTPPASELVASPVVPPPNEPRPPSPELPEYEVLQVVQEYRSTRLYAEVLVPSLSPASDLEDKRRIARAIAELEGFDSMTVYCTREARKAHYNMDFATQNPDVLVQGYLGDLERGRFRSYRD